MIKDTCKCGAEFEIKDDGTNAIQVRKAEADAHTRWLDAHKRCREPQTNPSYGIIEECETCKFDDADDLVCLNCTECTLNDGTMYSHWEPKQQA